MSREIVPGDTYLYRRGEGGTFYLHMRVPTDCVATYGSEKVFVSLKTKDRATARRLRNARVGELEDRFEELRRTGKGLSDLKGKVARNGFANVTPAELERLVVGYFRDALEPAALNPPADDEEREELAQEWEETLALYGNRRDERSTEYVQGTADHILMKAGWPKCLDTVGVIRRSMPRVDVDRRDEKYGLLLDLVRRATVEGSRLALSELGGPPFVPSDPHFAPGFDPVQEEAKRGPLISEALTVWREGGGVRGSRKPRELTAREADMAVRHFVQLNGDMRIGDIGKKVVQDYAAAISKIPVKLPAKLQKLPLPDLLNQDLSKLRPRSASTVNKSLQMLSAMVERARRQSDLDQAESWPNHFKGERVESDATAEDDRLPFSADDLRRIFIDGPVHGQRKRQTGGQGDAQHWLPLLGLFTGARLSELGQLRVCDVCSDDSGIAFLSIGTSGGRTVKTRTSVRKVPVHPELRRLGFLTYVDRVKTSAGTEATLWPLLGSAEGRARTAAFSQWFGNYLRREPVSITDRRKVFHSFRHLFKDMCRDAGLSEDVHDALTGHAGSKSVGRGYGSGHSVARMHMEIGKVLAPIALSHLNPVRVRARPVVSGQT